MGRATLSMAANKLSRVTHSGSIRVISQRAMRTASARLASFNGWTNDAVTPLLLSAAGFFYRGIDDQTQCISCFLVISQWGAEHDPWSEHQRHGPTCEFINAHSNHLADGVVKIGQSLKEAPVLRADLPEPLHETVMCKICYGQEMTILFRPCGHLLACHSCADQLTSCPICRRSILENIRAYIVYQ